MTLKETIDTRYELNGAGLTGEDFSDSRGGQSGVVVRETTYEIPPSSKVAKAGCSSAPGSANQVRAYRHGKAAFGFFFFVSHLKHIYLYLCSKYCRKCRTRLSNI